MTPQDEHARWPGSIAAMVITAMICGTYLFVHFH